MTNLQEDKRTTWQKKTSQTFDQHEPKKRRQKDKRTERQKDKKTKRKKKKKARRQKDKKTKGQKTKKTLKKDEKEKKDKTPSTLSFAIAIKFWLIWLHQCHLPKPKVMLHHWINEVVWLSTAIFRQNHIVIVYSSYLFHIMKIYWVFVKEKVINWFKCLACYFFGLKNFWKNEL